MFDLDAYNIVNIMYRYIYYISNDKYYKKFKFKYFKR